MCLHPWQHPAKHGRENGGVGMGAIRQTASLLLVLLLPISLLVPIDKTLISDGSIPHIVWLFSPEEWARRSMFQMFTPHIVTLLKVAYVYVAVFALDMILPLQ